MIKFKEIALWYVMPVVKFLVSVAEEHIPRTCCNIRAKVGRPTFFLAFRGIPTKPVIQQDIIAEKGIENDTLARRFPEGIATQSGLPLIFFTQPYREAGRGYDPTKSTFAGFLRWLHLSRKGQKNGQSGIVNGSFCWAHEVTTAIKMMIFLTKTPMDIMESNARCHLMILAMKHCRNKKLSFPLQDAEVEIIP